jgi:N-succinyldiaminopimelate aminotransferase
MNPNLERLHPYPFEHLAALLADITPAADRRPIALTIGEPQHEPPAVAMQALRESLPLVAKYPSTAGSPELRGAFCDWMQRRYGLPRPDPERQVLPLSGTREGLFAIAQTCVDTGAGAVVASPNPFYQIYEGAALLAGAELRFINCSESNGFLPDPDALDRHDWERCQLLYLCSPGNPSGAVMPVDLLARFIERAQRHQVVLVSDECYSEIYADEDQPPPGLLQACRLVGNSDFRRCLSVHSLSKRSNLPGLRSGFIAGDATLIKAFTRYRTYHGCAMPVHHQAASIAAWRDEAHVVSNREAYRRKFDAVMETLSPHLPLTRPEAGFYLWPQTPIDDTEFARRLYAQENVRVLPGRYLAREADGINPGEHRVRLALVAPEADCVEAAQRIARFVEGL